MNTHEEIYAMLQAGSITGKQAVDSLVSLGMPQLEAQESVFIELGGDDVIEIHEDGTNRYAISGKTVEEVEAAMGYPPEAAPEAD